MRTEASRPHGAMTPMSESTQMTDLPSVLDLTGPCAATSRSAQAIDVIRLL